MGGPSDVGVSCKAGAFCVNTASIARSSTRSATALRAARFAARTSSAGSARGNRSPSSSDPLPQPVKLNPVHGSLYKLGFPSAKFVRQL